MKQFRLDRGIPAYMQLLLTLRDADRSWTDDALCAQVDSELFFPEKGESSKTAKKVCANCVVQAECLDFALTTHQPHGVWGGTSANERRQLLKQTGQPDTADGSAVPATATAA